MTRPIVDFVSLSDLARELGIPRKRLLRQLQTINAEVGGMALRQSARPRGKIWVNRTALMAFSVEARGIVARIVDLEAHAKQTDDRLTNVEAMVA